MNRPANSVSQETDEFTAGIIRLLRMEISLARHTLPTAMLSEAKGYEHGASWARKVELQLIKHSHMLAAMLPEPARPARFIPVTGQADFLPPSQAERRFYVSHERGA